jgi:hypothetical protein
MSNPATELSAINLVEKFYEGILVQTLASISNLAKTVKKMSRKRPSQCKDAPSLPAIIPMVMTGRKRKGYLRN